MREHPKRAVAAVCAAIIIILLGQVAGWDYRNFACMFLLSRACIASSLNRSPALRNVHLKVQAVGNIKYVGPSEALVEYLIEPDTATPADEDNPNSSQIRMAAFHKVFYRWRLEP